MRFYARMPRLNPTGSLNEYRVAPTESFVMEVEAPLFSNSVQLR
jgi:hypothetical protein